MSEHNIAAIYPLSPMQQGMLAHTLLNKDPGTYFEQLSCAIHGDLDIPAFQQVWQCVVDRHDILRTFFVWEELDKPIQIVRKRATLRWQVLDWRTVAADERPARLAQLLEADRRRGFDLSKAPLMRLALIQIAEQEFQVVWSYHHILLDGWCQPLLLREVLTLYEAAGRNTIADLAPTRPYRDYLAWLQRQNIAQAEPFWREMLRGLHAPTPLVVDRPARGESSEASALVEERAYLSEATTAALQSIAHSQHLTLNTLVQGAWALLLSRYSGEENVVFGVTVSGRPAELPGVESMIGLFINTLPMRVHVPRSIGLLSWLRQIQSQRIELHRYEYTPLAQIHEWSDIPRTLPLFESILVFQNRPSGATLRFQASGLEIQQVRSSMRTNYPLNVIAVAGRQLSLSLYFAPDRFEQRTVARMLGHLQTILEEIERVLSGPAAARPEPGLAALALLTASERHQILIGWNDTARPYASDRCLHAIFEAQVERTPDAIAVAAGERQLTYRVLNARANALAHHLRTRGVGPDTLVGVCMERSLDLVIALLAILKAGGAYVPFDPTYPRERLAFMIADTRTPVVLTQQSTMTILPTAGCHIVCLDSDAINAAPAHNPEHRTTPEHLAYVIYTSGSTGVPKGVMVPHRAINRLVCNTNYIALQPGDVIAQASNSAFDAATFEIWGALLNGARLVIMTRDVLLSPDDFAFQLAAFGVQSIFLTTSLFNQMARIAPGCFKHVREVLFGGEACNPKAAREVLSHGPPQRLLNVYGPTETTTFTTWCLIEQVEERAVTIPIGRPLSNDRAYVLDRALQPVAIGVEGELYIGGAGLAHGYFNRPELTAERFVPNPFADFGLADEPNPIENPKSKIQNGERLYRTGDRVRYREDGAIEYLGRFDQQIKLRGFRIECGEISAVLERHPAVEISTVIAREDRSGERQLVAYVVLRSGASPGVQALRSFMAERLPSYMLPAAYVIVDALPLNSNGKIEYRALPPPGLEAYVNAGEHVAPRTLLERQIAAIWSDVLGIQEVSVYDDFFALGGHSLLATRLMLQLRDKLQIDLALHVLYQSPTVAGIADAIQVALAPAPNQHSERDVPVGSSSRAPTLDLRAEVVLDPSITGVAPGNATLAGQQSNPSNVFLTGATGFLGVYLLHELLVQTNATVYCLTRAADWEAASSRIRRTLETYQLWDAALSARIIPVVGDLAQPRLGLKPEEFDWLAGEIDAIYHNGALVNFIYPYSAMQAANVLGTQESLRLAARHKLKPFHYISTLGVFSSIDASQHPCLSEDTIPTHWEGLSGGYSQSKWVAEQIVGLAQSRGIPTAIYRVGTVSGHSQTGAYQTGDFFCQMLKASLAIGSIGEGFLRTEMRLAPVDYVSSAIVYLSRQPTSIGQAFHLFNTQTIPATAVLEGLRSFPLPIRVVPDRQWREAMIAAAQDAPESTVARLVAFLPPGGAADTGMPQEQVSGSAFGYLKTHECLAGSGIVCPALSADLIRAYLQYFIQIGFIELPAGVESIELIAHREGVNP